MSDNTHPGKYQLEEQAVSVSPQPSDGDASVAVHQRDGREADSSDSPASEQPELELEPGREPEREGGLQAWLAIIGSFMVYFATFGVVNSFGFFQTYYQLDYLNNYSLSTISFLGTLQITLMYLSGSVAGALFDTYGLKWMYPFAALGGAGSMLATSFTQRNHIWQQFLAQSALFGITVAYGVQPALTLAGQYFHRRRALAMGLVASGSSIGGVVLPILFSKLIPRIGFAWALRVGALILLCCYLIAMAISRSKYPPKKLQSLSHLLDFRGFLDIRYTCLSVGAFVASLGVYVPFYYLESYCIALDPNTNLTPYLLPLINAASLVGRIAGGWAGDRFGRLNVLYPMVTLCGVFCLAMWLPSTHPGVLVAFALLYGFSSGIFISVMPAATGQIIPTENLGARLGAFSTVTAFAFLIGTPVAGALIQAQTRSGYQPLILFCGCSLVAGGLVIFLARVLHDKNLRSKW